MSDYVNKVQKEGVDYDIHDERIAALSDIASLDGSSLVIPEQAAPEPVITIDGVDYYHKCEFDLEELASGKYATRSLLTGEVIEFSPTAVGNISHGSQGPDQHIIFLFRYGSSASYCLYTETTQTITVNFTSRALTPVDSIEEVTDTTKIYLPACSAYYGFLSEDGKTFISYYNLKSEGAPEYVDSIKQGNAVIPLKDNRVPDSAVADAGKVVKVAEDGSYELGEAGGSDVIQEIEFNFGQTTFQQIAERLGLSGASMSAGSAVFMQKSNNKSAIYIFTYVYYGNYSGKVTAYGLDNIHRYITNDPSHVIGTGGDDEVLEFVPELPNDSAEKTYVLKAVNGYLQWVEETA